MDELYNDEFEEILRRERKYWPKIREHLAKLETNIQEKKPLTEEDIYIFNFLFEQVNNSDKYELNRQLSFGISKGPHAPGSELSMQPIPPKLPVGKGLKVLKNKKVSLSKSSETPDQGLSEESESCNTSIHSITSETREGSSDVTGMSNTDVDEVGICENHTVQKVGMNTMKKKLPDEDFKNMDKTIQKTDFPNKRRRNRKTSRQIEKERDDLWRVLVKSQCQDGLEIGFCPIKGRCIFTTKEFKKGDFIVEYRGDIFYPDNIEESYARDSKYIDDPEIGSFMYWFNFGGKKYCIDATEETPFYGRLLNHSKKTPNCATKPLDMQDPFDPVRLVIYAREDIPIGTELLFDYGDRSKKSLELHPWLKH